MNLKIYKSKCFVGKEKKIYKKEKFQNCQIGGQCVIVNVKEASSEVTKILRIKIKTAVNTG